LKSILIHNFHINGTQSIVNDFLALGYTVYSPIDDWEGRIKYYRNCALSLDSVYLAGVRHISYEEFINIKPEYVLLGCFEQYADFSSLAFDVSAKRIIHCAGNDQPLVDGNMVICPDLITYKKYELPKVMYLSMPVIRTDKKKDFLKSYKGEIGSFIGNYANFWKEGYPMAVDFKDKYGNCNLYEDLDWIKVQEKMVDCYFTLYFKDRDCWGNSVLEGMWLGTPVIACRRFISDTSLGNLLLSDRNSIIVDSVDEAIDRLKNLTLEQYQELCENAMADVRKVTDKEDRLNKLRSLGL
jgi:hypothetical protein